MTTAFIAKGKLYLLSDDGKAEEIRSEFAEKQEREADRRQSYSPWAKEDNAAGAFGGVNVWAGHAGAAKFTNYVFTDVSRVDENTLLYTMTNGTVTGLFEYDLTEKTERRLVHRNELHFLGMDYAAVDETLVVGRTSEDGSTHLETVDKNGRTVHRLTEGDSVDCFPSRSHANPDVVLFQSSGIARTEDGTLHAIGPACINRMDLGSGEMEEIIADDSRDFLLPREDKGGAVYCIRRPYNSQRRVPFWKSLLDFVMFPVFFAQALYNFLKVFTQLFKNEPTMADGPPPQLPAQDQHVRVLGQTISLGKAQANKKDDEASLVPDDWQLIKIVDGKEPEVIAKGVCAFDIAPSGEVTYTNGYRIRASASQTSSEKFDIVEKVRCL